jgi:hypothetical protein
MQENDSLERQESTSTDAGSSRSQGHLKEYRSVDDVWNFTIKNAVMKLEGGNTTDKQ